MHANKLFSLLRRNLSTCDRKVEETAYLGLVRPLLQYASQAWDPYTNNLTDKIEKVQIRAARFVMSDYRNHEPGSVTSLINQLGIHSREDVRLIEYAFSRKDPVTTNILPLDSLVRPSRKTRHMRTKHYIPIASCGHC